MNLVGAGDEAEGQHHGRGCDERAAAQLSARAGASCSLGSQ
jgi:hypothetical protein